MSPPTTPKLIECSDCGLVQTLPPATPDRVAECARCARRLAGPARGTIGTPLALSLAALLLLLPSALSPLMNLTAFGMQRRTWLRTGAEVMWNGGFTSLATVVFLSSIAIPFIYFGLMVCVLGGIRLGVTAPLGRLSLGRLFRWAGRLRPWVMIEVYLVGCCVAYTRLDAIGTVNVDVGGWCLIGAALVTVLAVSGVDERAVWSALSPHVEPPVRKRPISCAACELLLDEEHEHFACPRCGGILHRRKPDAMRRTIALVLAGFLLYLPANLLPVLSIDRFGREEPNTILGGVRALISSGLWPLAVIVFTASIVVPLMKLFGLSLMLVLTHWRSRRWLVGRTRLFRLIDLIGRWSNIDLFMISILVALVRFGTLTSVRPEAGAVAFAAVVVITMMASRCFDARVMWDATGSTL